MHAQIACIRACACAYVDPILTGQSWQHHKHVLILISLVFSLAYACAYAYAYVLVKTSPKKPQRQQPRRRRQRERHKTKGLMNKYNALARAFYILIQFFTVLRKTTTSNDQIIGFVENKNTQQLIFLSPFELQSRLYK